MSGLIRTALEFAAKRYQASVGSACASYGLKYQDLLIEFDDVNLALDRIDNEALVDRERRIKRAFDASAKKKLLPIENQTKDPLHHYLTDHMERAEKDRQEREIMNRY